MQICPDQTWMLGLWRKLSCILDSPWQHVQQCHKRGKACCQDSTDVPVELAFIFPSFKERSGVVDFFCLEEEPLPWVEPELLLFCLELEEPFLDLLSDLLELDSCSDLLPEDLEAQVLWESSPFHSQYHALIAWMSF